MTRNQLLQSFHSAVSRFGGDTEACQASESRREIGEDKEEQGIAHSYAGKKYKPVALKVKPVRGTLPQQYRIVRNITGEPLAELPELSKHPPDFEPVGRYTVERKRIIDDNHPEGFLWDEERKLLHHFMMVHEDGFAWEDSETGKFKEEYFPPIEFPVVEHIPWVEKNIPIPPGIFTEVCNILKRYFNAGVYEPSNSSYRARWFCVVKKDGKSLRIVHSLEPLNKVTIAHSGIPPATEDLAERFAGRSCVGCLDLYIGYHERELAVTSRDLTTFQTPFGAWRHTKLPMGWTNSVPIFHDDVTYILREEIPHTTIPYIDDVPVGGPPTRYELPEGGYETLKENSGIRRFVWEMFQNLNRIVQRMKYAGGTFSGKKAFLCVEEVEIVGHTVSYEGRKPKAERVKLISNWGIPKDVSDLRGFLGTVGVCRVFIKDFSKHAEPLLRLLRKDANFIWEKEHQEAMDKLKELVATCPAIRPLDYDLDWPIVVAVDTSWKAVGFYVYQEDPTNAKKKYIARFGSITLNEREARFSQPKRELYGLMRALDALQYWILGARNLVVETDAKYLKGMLQNPGMGPNATINRWIEQILMYHFTLRHVKGKNFPADGPSRRDPQPGDETYPNPDEEFQDDSGLAGYEGNSEAEEPLNFDEFKGGIDTRGGYAFMSDPEPFRRRKRKKKRGKSDGDYRVPGSVQDFYEDECTRQWEFEETLNGYVKEAYGIRTVKVKNNSPPQKADLDRPDAPWKTPVDLIYFEDRRSATAKRQDNEILKIKGWLINPLANPLGVDSAKSRKRANRQVKRFLVDKEGRLFRKDPMGKHKLFVEKQERMQVMHSAHESLAHRGFFSTKELIGQRFWWPEWQADVKEFCLTCLPCQHRKTEGPVPKRGITDTPPLFKKFALDTMSMTPASRGNKFIIQGRDVFSGWLEGIASASDDGRTIALFLLHEVFCRWGLVVEILTDNGSAVIAALKFLKERYGITGIKISPYNKPANGKAERTHYDVRQALWKMCYGHISRWADYYPYVKWADRISVRKTTGVSPYFLVVGLEPIFPLDLDEATWLIKYPDRKISRSDLIALRARSLVKHNQDREAMMKRMEDYKRKVAQQEDFRNRHKIKEYLFEPGDLVLVKVRETEYRLDKKMHPRYSGPWIVLRRNKGGSYLLAEMDGTLWKSKIAKERVIPFRARGKIDIPENVKDLISEPDRILEALGDIEDTKGKEIISKVIKKYYEEEDVWDLDEDGPRAEPTIDEESESEGEDEEKESSPLPMGRGHRVVKSRRR